MRKILRSKANIVYLLLICSFLLFLQSAHADKEERYVPYPIIFVSGLGTSNIINDSHSPANTWNYLISSYEDYFVNSDETSKYLDSSPGVLKNGEEPHLEYFIYDSNSGIEGNAGLLARYIEKVLSRYYPDTYRFSEPCAETKVIIVAHSMGGIITRYMLTDYTQAEDMRGKVDSVFLLGVPHLGSPLATIAYLALDESNKLDVKLNKIKQAKLTQMNLLQKYLLADLLLKIRRKRDGNNFLKNKTLNFLNIDIDGAGLEDLLIPRSDACSYSHTFRGRFLGRSVGTPVSSTYDYSKQFLFNLSSNLNVPVYSIIGNDTIMRIRYYFFLVEGGATFPEFNSNDYTCIQHGYYDDGDGVVSLSSQSETNGEKFNITSIHISHP